MFVAAVVTALAYSKIQFVGRPSGALFPTFWAILIFVMVIAVVFMYGILVVIWFIESVIVKFACGKGSGWDLKPAASITGYTFLVDIILVLVTAVAFWFLIPPVTINIADLKSAQQAVTIFRAQLDWFWLCCLPVSLLGIAWKSYLGSLGAYFGTGGKCSRKWGFMVFFCIGFIGLLISFIAYALW